MKLTPGIGRYVDVSRDRNRISRLGRIFLHDSSYKSLFVRVNATSITWRSFVSKYKFARHIVYTQNGRKDGSPHVLRRYVHR